MPQTGSGVEAGLQHRLELLSGRLVTGWSLSAYQMDMRHELDFDIATLRYVNVAESRHRGIEASTNVVGPEAMTAAVTYALQDAVATNGDNAGRFLRAIPRHTLTARVSHDPVQGLSLSAAAVRVADAPFDNENSRDLPRFTRVDARASYAIGVVRLVGEVRNVLDASYSSTGFPDPGGSGAGFYYPPLVASCRSAPRLDGRAQPVSAHDFPTTRHDLMKQIRGKTALVTGASRGIGPHIVRALAEEGMNLVLRREPSRRSSNRRTWPGPLALA